MTSRPEIAPNTARLSCINDARFPGTNFLRTSQAHGGDCLPIDVVRCQKGSRLHYVLTATPSVRSLSGVKWKCTSAMVLPEQRARLSHTVLVLTGTSGRHNNGPSFARCPPRSAARPSRGPIACTQESRALRSAPAHLPL